MVRILKKGITKDFLIFLAALADEFENQSIRYRTWRAFNGSDYKPATFTAKVARLLSVGEIKKIEKDGEIYYRLESKGSERLKENIPILKLAKRHWDGNWRIVIFDIKEKNKLQRESLRKKLLSLGFRMWQKSVYITPHDLEQEINQFLDQSGLKEEAVCLVAKRTSLGDDKSLSEKVWHLNEINDNYLNIIDNCQKLLKEVKLGIDDFNKIYLEYKNLILNDPSLPKELLPDNWQAPNAKKMIKELYVRICDRLSIRNKKIWHLNDNDLSDMKDIKRI